MRVWIIITAKRKLCLNKSLSFKNMYLFIIIYSQTCLTDHLHISTTPLYRSPHLSPYDTIVTILKLSTQTTSLNGPPPYRDHSQLVPIVGLFREVLLHILSKADLIDRLSVCNSGVYMLILF